jgi:hypothetical protein
MLELRFRCLNGASAGTQLRPRILLLTIVATFVKPTLCCSDLHMQFLCTKVAANAARRALNVIFAHLATRNRHAAECTSTVCRAVCRPRLRASTVPVESAIASRSGRKNFLTSRIPSPFARLCAGVAHLLLRMRMRTGISSITATALSRPKSISRCTKACLALLGPMQADNPNPTYINKVFLCPSLRSIRDNPGELVDFRPLRRSRRPDASTYEIEIE